MTMRPLASNRGFTLAELIVSMTLGMIVMLAVFSTYLYLGRNLTRLSYRSTMENQSRKILNTVATDIRNAKSVVSASVTALTLNNVINTIPNNGPVPLMKVVYAYNVSLGKLTRTTSNPDGSGATPPVILNNDIGDANMQVPVTLPSFSFLYYTTGGGDPVSQFSPPAITPLSVKQVAVSFTLQAGDATQTTLSSYPAASGLMPLINRTLPDGS